MSNLLLLPTYNTPFIYGTANNGKLIIIGKSTPNSVVEIIKPVEEWIHNFAETTSDSLEINIDLCFYDTPTSLMVSSILMMLNKQSDKEKRFSINWYFFSEDEDMMEEGEEFKSIAKFPFTLVCEEYTKELSIGQTPQSPLIYIDSAGDFVIKGQCNHPNPMAFYRPILKWLSDLLISPTIRYVHLDILLDSVSPSNAPYVKAIMYFMEAIHKQGVKAHIEWNYSSPNIEKFGEEILKNLTLHYYFKEVSE